MADSPTDEETVIVSEVLTSPVPSDCVENSTTATVSTLGLLSSVSSPPENQEESLSLQCSICLQACSHPVELPCKHIFCFLCIKGVAMQGPHARCALCRSNIPHNVLTHPTLKDVSQLYKHVKTTSGYEWFYEARGGGWWQYDERSILELEKAYEAGQTTCQLLIAGHLYDIDFNQMTQFRQSNPNFIRRIKRDTASAEKRGIAGIRLNQTPRGTTNGGSSNGPPTAPSTRRRRHNATHQIPQTMSDSVFSAMTRGGNQSQNDSSQSQPSSRSSTSSGQLVVVSESESDNECAGEEDERDSDDEYIGEEEDDMELGEEEELGESISEEEDEEELRDGARAPTRRSDRSNSSTNQTPPPASATNGATAVAVNGTSRNPSNTSPNSNPSGRASRGTKSEKANSGSRSSTNSTIINNGGGSGAGGGAAVHHGNSSSGSSPSPQLFVDGGMRTISASNIRLSPAPIQSDMPHPSQTGCNNNLGSSRTSSSSITTTTGLTCLLIGPGVRITVDKDNSNNDEGDDIL